MHKKQRKNEGKQQCAVLEWNMGFHMYVAICFKNMAMWREADIYPLKYEKISLQTNLSDSSPLWMNILIWRNGLKKKFIDQIAVHAYIVNGDLDGV